MDASRRRALGMLVLSGILLAGCAVPTPTGTASPTPSTPAPSPSPVPTATPSPTPAPPPAEVAPAGEPAVVAVGLDAPWSLVFVGETPLVSERDTGRILEIGPGTTRVVAEVTGVVHGGEGGLLGLAVRERDLYVYSTSASGNRIERYPLTGSAGSLGLGAPTTLIDGLPSAGNHNGGRIAFGPDGLLYAGVGDAAQPERAQDPGYLGGKILRLAPNGSVPSDNPFPGSPVFSLGHRNVQGLGWSADGTMWASEFGQNTWDELNVIRAGADYGWPTVEGVGGDARFVDPVQQWSTDEASPSGLAVVGGTVFLANLRGEVLRAVPAARPGERADHFGGAYGRLRDAVLGPDGRLWFLSNETDGRGSPADGDDRLFAVPMAP
ncbi:PQQ-dependent sugar dehydrogenase [Agromyces seonyuensis]|uniref:PQQ-dependent sugar dehydrogenase n=1 Tax=Agromyces seonyuensis TaxID=2662446 RepID=A0A6I4P6A9_9MICO|nr:PQQ-dependent sugar dehydrogenase [Agromyces seonyuensis]MWB99117.1 PQQ-dependent sugar dehydrogenase [Agromyces seonyuensis]